MPTTTSHIPYRTSQYRTATKRTGKGHTLTWLPSQGIFPLDALLRVSSIVYCLCVCCVLCAVLYIDVSSALLSVLCAVHCPILYIALGCTVLHCTVLYRTRHCYSYDITLYYTIPCLLYRTYTTMLAPPFLLYRTYVLRWILTR